MGVRFPSVASTTIVASPGGSTETVICTTPPLNIPLDFAQVIILWSVRFSAGPTGWNVSYNVRRGTTTTGALVNVTQNILESINQPLIRSGSNVDTPGAVAGQQWSLTFNIISTTTAATVVDVVMLAFAL